MSLLQVPLERFMPAPKFAFLKDNPQLERAFRRIEEKYATKGEVVSRPAPEPTVSKTVVDCCACGAWVDVRDATVFRAFHTGDEHWRMYKNPAWIPIRVIRYVDKKTNRQFVKEINENHPDAKEILFEKVRHVHADWMCKACASRPFTAAVKNLTPSPEHTLDVADAISEWKRKFGPRLEVVGFGRPIDSTVQMVCTQLKVRFTESAIRL